MRYSSSLILPPPLPSLLERSPFVRRSAEAQQSRDGGPCQAREDVGNKAEVGHGDKAPVLKKLAGRKPNRLAPGEHPNPTTKIGSKMGGAPKMVPLVLTHSQLFPKLADQWNIDWYLGNKPRDSLEGHHKEWFVEVIPGLFPSGLHSQSPLIASFEGAKGYGRLACYRAKLNLKARLKIRSRCVFFPNS